MTHPHDPPRQWSRPVEEVARAIAPLAWAALGTGDTLAHKNRRTASLRHAEVALTRLISLGFLNENGIEAMKAEKEAKT